MGKQHDLQRQPLAPNQTAVLETLFEQIHVHPDQGTFAIRDLANAVNLNLKRTGECFRLNPRGVGAVLTTLGFLNRDRTNSGWVVWLDRGARKRIHELISLYGVDGLAPVLSAKKPWKVCDFCKGQDGQRPEIPPADGSTSRPSTEGAGRDPSDATRP
jgi:hypothetical protein